MSQRQFMMTVAGETFPVWMDVDEVITTEGQYEMTIQSSFEIRPVDYERAHNAITIANREKLGLGLRAPKTEELCEKV